MLIYPDVSALPKCPDALCSDRQSWIQLLLPYPSPLSPSSQARRFRNFCCVRQLSRFRTWPLILPDFSVCVRAVFVLSCTTTWYPNLTSYRMGDYYLINPLTPNDRYRGRTAPLTSKRCIIYIYSINIGTEYFKHGIYSPSLSPKNAVCFIILTYLVPVLFTFYIQCPKIKKIIPAPKG